MRYEENQGESNLTQVDYEEAERKDTMIQYHEADLMPCPFCGSDARLHEVSLDGENSIFAVRCTGCGAESKRVNSGFHILPEQREVSCQEAAEMVVDAWNRRTTSAGEDASA